MLWIRYRGRFTHCKIRTNRKPPQIRVGTWDVVKNPGKIHLPGMGSVYFLPDAGAFFDYQIDLVETPMEFPWALWNVKSPFLTSHNIHPILKCLYITMPSKVKLLVIFKVARLDFCLTAQVIAQAFAATSDSMCFGSVAHQKHCSPKVSTGVGTCLVLSSTGR